MSEFDFPSLPFSRVSFEMVSASELSISKANGAEHIVDNPGERWHVQYYFKMLTHDEAKLLKQHLKKLFGSVNYSRCFDPLFKTQSGTWGGSPVVDGAGQYGMYVNARGFAANQVVGEALDRCLIGNQLMELSDDVTSDASGNATLYFTSELRALTTDGMAITSDVSALRTRTRWTKPDQIKQLSGDRRLYKGITLDFMEAFT